MPDSVHARGDVAEARPRPASATSDTRVSGVELKRAVLKEMLWCSFSCAARAVLFQVSWVAPRGGLRFYSVE